MARSHPATEPFRAWPGGRWDWEGKGTPTGRGWDDVEFVRSRREIGHISLARHPFEMDASSQRDKGGVEGAHKSGGGGFARAAVDQGRERVHTPSSMPSYSLSRLSIRCHVVPSFLLPPLCEATRTKYSPRWCLNNGRRLLFDGIT